MIFWQFEILWVLFGFCCLFPDKITPFQGIWYLSFMSLPSPGSAPLPQVAFIQDFGHVLKVTGCLEKDLGLYTKP